MTKPPAPPTVGHGSTPTDEATREAAHAGKPELSASASDRPDAWLLGVEPPPPPAPLRAEPVVDGTVEPPADAPPRGAPTSPPAATLPPTSGGIAPDRRTLVVVAAILGTALVAVLVARCSSGELGTRAEPIAGTTVRGGGNPLVGSVADGPDGRAGIAGAEGEASRRDDAADRDAVDGSAAGGAASDRPDEDAAEPAPAQPTPADGAPTADTAAEDPDDDAPIVDDEPTVDAVGIPASTDPKVARPSSRTDSAAGSGSPADPPMTAEESLAKARAAWKAGDAKDTYKYANKSRFKQPSDEATELATLAACKMKLDDSAKSSYRQLDGERKKRTRIACRDFGVRVGL